MGIAMASDGQAGLLTTEQRHRTTTQRFEQKEYDVSNKIEPCCACFWTLGILGWTRKTLVLTEEEAHLTVKNNCKNDIQRRPYAQLGAVDKVNTCICCWAVRSDLTSPTKDGPGGLSPGLGCDQTLVEELVHELKERMINRGNIGQIRHQENMGLQVTELGAKMDLLMDHLGIQYPPSEETLARLYPNGRPNQQASPPQQAMLS